MGLLFVGFPDATPVHPVAVAMLEHGETEDLDCRENPLPEERDTEDRPGRAAGFRLSGHYTCYRPVFTAAERDPFIGRTLAAQSTQAKRVAVALKSRLAGKSFSPIAVVVAGLDESALREQVAAIYRTELTAALGPEHVLRGQAEGDATVMRVKIERVDPSENSTRVRLSGFGRGEIEI